MDHPPDSTDDEAIIAALLASYKSGRQIIEYYLKKDHAMQWLATYSPTPMNPVPDGEWLEDLETEEE